MDGADILVIGLRNPGIAPMGPGAPPDAFGLRAFGWLGIQSLTQLLELKVLEKWQLVS